MAHRKVNLEITSMSFITAEMRPTSPGRFLISCQIHSHRYGNPPASSCSHILCLIDVQDGQLWLSNAPSLQMGWMQSSLWRNALSPRCAMSKWTARRWVTRTTPPCSTLSTFRSLRFKWDPAENSPERGSILLLLRRSRGTTLLILNLQTGRQKDKRDGRKGQCTKLTAILNFAPACCSRDIYLHLPITWVTNIRKLHSWNTLTRPLPGGKTSSKHCWVQYWKEKSMMRSMWVIQMQI